MKLYLSLNFYFVYYLFFGYLHGNLLYMWILNATKYYLLLKQIIIAKKIFSINN